KETLAPRAEETASSTPVRGEPVEPQRASAASDHGSTGSPRADEGSAHISIDDFARLDLRVGVVKRCEHVEGADKLLRFVLDAGELGERQIFSGIKSAYPDPEKLNGRKVVFIANLAPR